MSKVLTAFAVTVWMLSPAYGQEKKDEFKHKFVGNGNCKLCHSDPDTGDQFSKWKKSPHAEAFKTLQGPKAKEIGAKLGIDDPSKSEKCVKCHVTGFGAPAAVRPPNKVKDADGVGCETCHGAGADYAKEDVFKKGKEAAIALGLVVPDEKLCVKCHNKESPSYKEFKFEEASKKIAHPNPKNPKK